MRKAALSLAIIALSLPFFAAAPAQAQAARTWVSGTGDDSSPTCSRTAPCRTFDAAISAAAAGGEINCLDAGSFGSAANPQVTITKAITISCEAGTAGVQATSGGGIVIFVQAATTDVVTLRGLDIDGQGTGPNGIGIVQAKAVHVEKCTIRNFHAFDGSAAGIFTGIPSLTVFLFVTDTVISDNDNGVALESTGGFKVASLKNVTITGSTSDGLRLPSSNVFVNVTKSIISGNGGSAVNLLTSSTTVNIDRSTIANNAVALNAAAGGSTIRISGNNIYNNTTGFVIASGAQIQTDSTNNTAISNGGARIPNASLTKN